MLENLSVDQLKDVVSEHALDSSRLALKWKMWTKKCTAILRHEGFAQCHTDDCIWMCDMGDHCEHTGVHVDDLAVASKNPRAILTKVSFWTGTNVIHDCHP